MTLKHIPWGHGTTFRVIGGDEITIKATAEDTGGTYTLLETVTPPQAGPPPHVHHREDESFYVLEGDFEFQIGDEKVRAAAGTFLIAPRDMPHRFTNVSQRPGKLLIICQPAGFEKFVEEFAQLPADAPPDISKMVAIGKKYGLEFLPP